MASKVERIGIVFVHGIGEQRRFEHLDAEIRPFIDALRRRHSLEGLTVEIVAGDHSTLRADQDTWAAQPVRAVVREGGREKHIFFHEVWWADVNEPYSLRKEFAFWMWGLSVWAFPSRSRKLAGEAVMDDPHFPRKSIWTSDLVARLRLLFVSNIFLMGAFSVGLVIFFARRLLNFSPPKLVRIFVNYVSAVKLYVQPSRVDGGFLDAYGEPPRVSVRRRMIRAIADVSMANYDRWYIFAHSLGSVVAQNGVMENAHALPNYLDEKRWRRLRAMRLGGKARRGRDYVGDVRRMLPARPLWLDQGDVVYRDKLFGKFRGLLTYGSPLDKFAAIWPNRARINVREKAFGRRAEWINVYDPTDPVSANLDAYSTKKADLRPRNFGYAAFIVLLASHLRYMTGRRGSTAHLSDRLAEWVLQGDRFSPPKKASNWLWFQAGSLVEAFRRAVALSTAVFAYLFLTFLSALFISFPFASKTDSSASPSPAPYKVTGLPQVLPEDIGYGLDLLGDGLFTRLLRTLASDVWPPIARIVNATWNAMREWALSVPPVVAGFEALGRGVGAVLQPLVDFGRWIREAAKSLAGLAAEPDGKLWNAMLDAIEIAPRLMAFVLLITLIVGGVRWAVWLLRLTYRAPAR